MSYFKKSTKKTKFTFWEAHHFFWGVIMWVLGFYGIFVWSKWLVLALFAFGFWNMVDDMIQHIIQRRELEENGCYETVSFLHWWPYWLLRKLGLKK